MVHGRLQMGTHVTGRQCVCLVELKKDIYAHGAAIHGATVPWARAPFDFL